MSRAERGGEKNRRCKEAGQWDEKNRHSRKIEGIGAGARNEVGGNIRGDRRGNMAIK